MKKGMFRASGTAATGVLTVVKENGQVVCKSLSYTDDAAGLLKFYRASQKTTANAACSSSTTLKINTDASGYVNGAVLTTSDYVIVDNGSGSWQVRSIGTVGAVASSVVTLTLGSAATVASGATVYVVRAAEIHSVTTANETRVNLLDMFNSFRDYPVAIELTGSTGSKFFSGVYEVWD